jgi:hypothetical protein
VLEREKIAITLVQRRSHGRSLPSKGLSSIREICAHGKRGADATKDPFSVVGQFLLN